MKNVNETQFAQSAKVLSGYILDAEYKHFLEWTGLEEPEGGFSQAELLALCEEEGHTDHIYYHALRCAVYLNQP